MVNTEKKNQHYIPKFYLKKFSYKLNEKQIGVFNTKSNFFMVDAKLKTQASKNFFYGSDGKVEEALGILEKIYGETFNQIIFKEKLSKNDPNEKRELISFIVVSNLRNPVTIRNAQNIFSDIEMETKKLFPNEKLHNPTGQIPHEETVKILLSKMMKIAEYLKDLDYKLLINHSNIPFIISDLPIVKYNQFFEQAKIKIPLSYGSIGIQFFLPISPKLMVVFFDNRTYKIGFKKQQEIPLFNINEINQLNLLQFVNNENIIFFNESITEKYLFDLKTKSTKFLKANIPVVQNTKVFNKSEMKFENLVTRFETSCSTYLELSFIKKLPLKNRIFSNENGLLLREIVRKIRENKIF